MPAWPYYFRGQVEPYITRLGIMNPPDVCRRCDPAITNSFFFHQIRPKGGFFKLVPGYFKLLSIIIRGCLKNLIERPNLQVPRKLENHFTYSKFQIKV